MQRILLLAVGFMISASLHAQDFMLTFDGVDDQVDVGADVGNGLRTIEMWFKLEEAIDPSLSNFVALASREVSRQDNTNEFGLSFQPDFVDNPGTLRFDVDGTQPYKSVYSDSNTWNADQWYHVAAVIDPEEGMMLFIDGIKQASTHPNTAATASVSNPTVLGSWGDGVGRYFKGSMENVNFSTQALYNNSFTPSCEANIATSSRGFWNFNEGTGSAALDASSNGFDGVVDGPIWENSTLCPASVLSDGVVTLNGTGDYIDLGTEVGNSVRTIEMWFKLEEAIDPSLSDFVTLASREISGQVNTNEFSLSFQPDFVINPGTLRFDVDGTQPFKSVYSNSNTWNADQWYHVAAVIDPTEGMMLFIDGIKQASTHPNTVATASVSNATLLGTWGGGADRYFQGSLEDVHFSSEALYTNSFTPACLDATKTNSTLGLWNFNEDSGNLAADSSGNGFDATLVGALRATDKVCINEPAPKGVVSFDGEDDYIDLGVEVGNGVRTIEMWFKLDSAIDPSLSDFVTLASREISDQDNTNEFALSFQPSGVDNPGTLRFDVDGTVPFKSVYSDSNTWNADQWYHVAAVIDPTEGMMLFIDGIKQASTHPNTDATASVSNATLLGTWGDGV
ncbi:MAG TPA: hypothetical protein DCE41_04135, partial [Cytophagales bacterium]|nr:hypothetical protein [Cytophagales bacterium]